MYEKTQGKEDSAENWKHCVQPGIEHFLSISSIIDILAWLRLILDHI
jgi:hypothetical protein